MSDAIVLCQLECGHEIVVHIKPTLSVPSEFIQCLQCGHEVALYAMECREWRARCHHCSFARWCGASHEIAVNHQVNHSNKYGGHRVTVLYMIEPDKFQRLKKAYRRAVKFRIDGKPQVEYVRARGKDFGNDVPPF